MVQIGAAVQVIRSARLVGCELAQAIVEKGMIVRQPGNGAELRAFDVLPEFLARCGIQNMHDAVLGAAG